MKSYDDFIKRKISLIPDIGFDFKESKMNPKMFDFQKHILKKALKKGRYAVFADCGLGKTLIQLEFARIINERTEKPVLIFAPLAVSGQTIKEGKKFNIEVRKFDGEYSGIVISNYEQIDNIDCSKFIGIVLDESSILKNFTGVYRGKLTERFKNTQYKLCCTATPAPNDPNEIGQHSEFLNYLDSEDMRAKWFVRDEGMNNYRLKGHAIKSFYSWVSSWATMIGKPSDIGFSDEGFILPKLNITNYEIESKLRDNGKLFNDVTVNATEFQGELRATKEERILKVLELVKKNSGQIIIWVKQNEEADCLLKRLPEAVDVRGSEPQEKKEEKLLGFAENKFRILITKTKIAQFGLNYQNCAMQIFMSYDFSFESLYQAIRRSYRFGQKKEVNIALLTVDTMGNVLETINRKREGFETMQKEMNKIINEVAYGLKHEYDFREYKSDFSWLMNGDSCKEIKRIEDNSVDLIIYSPPFSSLFTYSNYIQDMGNSENHEEFFEHYAFLLKDLFRILKPGRLICTHTKDLAVYKNSSGYSGLYNFTGDHHRAVEEAGFKYHSKVCIWTDPVLEMQRTKTQRLLYKQVTKDSSASGIGIPEYVTIFRKWEGLDEETADPINALNKTNFDLDSWQAWASPVWSDIRRTDVLNNREGRAQGDEKHIAPLQLGVIKRLVWLYSNIGETVFTPFLGIGSEVYTSLLEGRKGIGIELKPSYFDVAVDNIKQAEHKISQPTIFDPISEVQ